MTKAEARKEITERAGIEFDPAVVKVFLTLNLLPELESFAPETHEVLSTPQPEQQDGWSLFSSFTS
jgi:response regulator RpfG family c-di-GMP phosphodiesterase